MDAGAHGEAQEQSGLRGLVTTMRPALGRFLIARGCNPAEAEDLLQDLFIKVEEMRSGPIANPQAYLFQTANNLLLDHRRGQRRQESRDDSWARNRFGHDLSHDPAPTPEQIAIARDRLARLEQGLAEMPPRTAQILRLYRVEGLSQKAIAGELEISLSAVEKHLQRAYQALRELKLKLDAEEPAPREKADG